MKINEVILIEYDINVEKASIDDWLATLPQDQRTAMAGVAQTAKSMIMNRGGKIGAAQALELAKSQWEKQQSRKGTKTVGGGPSSDFTPDEVAAMKANIKAKGAAGKGELDKETPARAAGPDDDVDDQIRRQAGWDDETHGHLRYPTVAKQARDIWNKNKIDMTHPGAAMASGGKLGARLMTPRTSFARKGSNYSIRHPKPS